MANGRQKGMRVAYLKKYSSTIINVGRNPDPLHPMGMRARNKALNSLTTVTTMPDPTTGKEIRRHTPHGIPVTIIRGKRGLTTARETGENPIPKAQVNRRLAEERGAAASMWYGLRYHGCKDYTCIVLLQRRNYLLELYFSGREWIFVQENRNTMKQARSRVYSTRIAAMDAVTQGRIHWAEVIPIPDPSTVPAPA